MITTPSWPRPSPTVWLKHLPNACTSVFAMSGATVATKVLVLQTSSRRSIAASGRPQAIRLSGPYREGPLWRLLDVQANTGMLITESFAMWPGSSVSGLYFAHPESRYFSLGKIDRDQVADYHERKGMSVAEVERWLGQNLNYDPAE